MTIENQEFTKYGFLNEIQYIDDFFEWYEIEGSDRLFELSRQLRTYLNYRNNVNKLIFSKSRSIRYTLNDKGKNVMALIYYFRNYYRNLKFNKISKL